MGDSILARYKQQYEQDKLNENYDLPDDAMPMDDMDAYKKAVDAFRNDDNDMEAQYNRFHQTYEKVSE